MQATVQRTHTKNNIIAPYVGLENKRELSNKNNKVIRATKVNSDSGSRGNKTKFVSKSNKFITRFSSNNTSKQNEQNKISNCKLSCLYLNARSIVNKHKELELYVLDKKFDIVGITETWMNSSISDSEMSISGYTLHRNDRNDAEKHRGGGVAFYIHSDLNCVHREEIFEQNFPESIWCNISYSGVNTLVGVCYRAPNSVQVNDEALYSLIDRVGKEEVVIMGDFNFPELDWGRPDSIDVSHPFIECMSNNFLTQLVEQPTRANNYLDLVLCSDSNLIENLNVEEPFETSDHQMVTFSLVTKEFSRKHPKQFYNYFKADYDEVRQYANSNDWGDNLNAPTVDVIWTKLKRNIIEIRNKFIPLKKPKSSQCRWVTRKVKRLREAKKKAWLKYVNSGKDIKLYVT